MKAIFFLYFLLAGIFAAHAQPLSGADGAAGSAQQSVYFSTCSLLTDGKVLLDWRVMLRERGQGFFVVERATEPGTFTTIATLKDSPARSMLSYTDEMPPKGRCFYRIRFIHGETNILSDTQSVTISGSDISCRFYPNPVLNTLLLRSSDDLMVEIMDGNGVVKWNKSVLKGINALDVTELQKGVYIIKFTQTQSGKVFSDKLVKH